VDVYPDVRWEEALTTVAPVYRWIKHERAEPIVEWPVDGWLTFRYLLGSAYHKRLSMNGTSGFDPPVYAQMSWGWYNKKYPRVLDVVEKNGGGLLVFHAHWMNDADRARAIRAVKQGLLSGRLKYLRRFDHGVEGDFVFAITRNLPNAEQLREPERPNGAAMFPQQTLDAFLDGRPTYNEGTFGRMEQPGGDFKGPLRVSGWAISSVGVAEVRVLLDNGRHTYTATRLKRPDITEKYPWYFEYDSGYELVIPERPRGVPRKTDVQVEIVDGNGHRTRLDDQVFEWGEGD
jgi:hypothetical protein